MFCSGCCQCCFDICGARSQGLIQVQDKSFSIVTILNECPTYTVYLARLNEGGMFKSVATREIDSSSNLYTLKRVRYENFTTEELLSITNDDIDDTEVSDYSVNEIRACQLFRDAGNIVDLLSYQINYQQLPTTKSRNGIFLSWFSNMRGSLSLSTEEPVLTSLSFTDLVFPYTCTLQDLLDKAILVPAKYALSDETVLGITKNIIKGLSIIHDKGYSYNNLSPDSVAFAHTSNLMDADFNRNAQLSDLSLVVKQPFQWDSNYLKYIKDSNCLYASPEILQATLTDKKKSRLLFSRFTSYTMDEQNPAIDGKAGDIWSLGCLVYCMLYGLNPFARQQQLVGGVSLEQTIIRGEYSFPKPRASNFSDTCQGDHFTSSAVIVSQESTRDILNKLIEQCLQVDPSKRCSLKDILALLGL